MFQSTRPRRARLKGKELKSQLDKFQSTRPRRARLRPDGPLGAVKLFQSTRPRRARPFLFYLSPSIYLFQSTRPRRARPASSLPASRACRVSIHAPAKGATLTFRGKSSPINCFNPRAREGRDPLFATAAVARIGFNPRAREGRDSIRRVRGNTLGVSIHAPAKGATIPPS